MSTSSVRKTRLYEKIIHAVIVECVIIFSFFTLFSSQADFAIFGRFATILLLAYLVGISVCTGFVAAFVAETKQLSGWKWGLLASGMTLLLVFMMIMVPTLWSGISIVIAPLSAIAILFVMLNVKEKN